MRLTGFSPHCPRPRILPAVAGCSIIAENVGSRKKRHQLGTRKAVRPPGRTQPVKTLSPLFCVGSGSGIECGKGPVVLNQNCPFDTQKFRTECSPHGVACPQGTRSARLPLPASRCGPPLLRPRPGTLPPPQSIAGQTKQSGIQGSSSEVSPEIRSGGPTASWPD